MALTNMIPSVWAASLLRSLNNAHVFAQESVISRDYEGDIKDKGDSVKINSIGRITIFDVSRNTDINAPEALDDAGQTLTIDQAKGFNFSVDDIDKAQSQPKVMDAAMQEAGWAVSDTADLYLANKYTDIAAGNFIGSDTTPVSLTTDNAYDSLVDLGVLLDESNVPQDGRWVILPSWVHGLLQKDDRFIHATTVGDQVLRNGRVGEAAGFTIMKSNNVANVNGAKYKVMAGHKIGWNIAEQIVKVEGYRPERRFGDAVKGLHVYGAKVTRPSALACLVATKG